MGAASVAGQGVAAAGSAMYRLRYRVTTNNLEGLQVGVRQPHGTTLSWCTHAFPLRPPGLGELAALLVEGVGTLARQTPASPECQRPCRS